MRSRHPETQRKKFKRDGGSWLGRDFVETTVEFKHVCGAFLYAFCEHIPRGSVCYQSSAA